MSTIYYRPSQAPINDNGPIYVVVADDTEEFNSALRFASHEAKTTNAKVAILYVMEEEQGVFFWGKIEERVKLERREEAEKFLKAIAEKFKAMGGGEPVLCLEEGEPKEAILEVFLKNPSMTKLILGGDTRGRSPGPLVSYFSGKGMSRLSAPLIVVPGHIAPERIDAL